MEKHKLIVIGSGPAGLTAALYAARAELSPVIIAGELPGGQLMWTTEVENFPGFPEGIMGPDLMANMIKQAEKFGGTMKYESVTAVDFSKKPFKITAGSNEYEADAVIIATGASARWLGLESETRLRGKGVSTCATCDGAFFKDKKIYVVGGGDSAMEEADFLTRFAASVTVLVRSDKLRASKIMAKRAEDNPKINFMWHTQVDEVLGEDKMTGLKLKNNETGDITEADGDGLFIAIGHDPNTGVFKDYIDLDEHGYILPHKHTYSNVEGVFVAGDVHDTRYRQAITAAGAGCKAAMDAEKYLGGHE